MSAEPAEGASRPMIKRIVVDFPEPFGPRKPVTVPGGMSKFRLSTASVPPYRLVSPRIEIMAQTLRTAAPRRHRHREPTPARGVVPGYDTAGGTTAAVGWTYAEERGRTEARARRPGRGARLAVGGCAPDGVRGRHSRLGVVCRVRARRGDIRRASPCPQPERPRRPGRPRRARLARGRAGGERCAPADAPLPAAGLAARLPRHGFRAAYPRPEPRGHRILRAADDRVRGGRPALRAPPVAGDGRPHAASRLALDRPGLGVPHPAHRRARHLDRRAVRRREMARRPAGAGCPDPANPAAARTQRRPRRTSQDRREMHDVVAHRMSMIAVQAETAP